MAVNKKKTKIKKAVAKPKAKVKAKVKVAAKPKGKPKKVLSKKNVKSPAAKVASKNFSVTELEMLLTPLDDRLLVMVKGPSETTPGGIIIPGVVSERPNQGQVLAHGRGRRNKKGQVRPLDVQVGDSVMFSDYAGTPITLKGADLLILREEDVLGVLQD